MAINRINRRWNSEKMFFCKPCDRNCSIPYEYEVTCVACRYNLKGWKHELTKTQRKNIINRMKLAGIKIICICIQVCKI